MLQFFQDGTTHLIWTFGNGPLYEITNLDINNDLLGEHGKMTASFKFLFSYSFKDSNDFVPSPLPEIELSC